MEEYKYNQELEKSTLRLKILEQLNLKHGQLLTVADGYIGALNTRLEIEKNEKNLLLRLRSFDEVFLRNRAAVLRLGFCPCAVLERTKPMMDGLLEIHSRLREYDGKLEETFAESKKQNKIRSYARTMIYTMRSDIDKMTHEELQTFKIPESINAKKIEVIPSFEDFDIGGLKLEWKNINSIMQNQLNQLENEFAEVCLEFGIRIEINHTSEPIAELTNKLTTHLKRSRSSSTVKNYKKRATATTG